MLYALRLSLPDRRGALSAVASAIGRAGGNISSLDVLGSLDGVAVDDMAVEAACSADDLRLAIETVPSVVVEAIREVDSFRDPAAPLRLASDMVDAGSGAVRILVEGLPSALWVTWALVVVNSHLGPEVLSHAGRAPSVDGLQTPWLPLQMCRRLSRAPWMPAAWRDRSDLQVVAAPLAQPNAAVLLGRDQGPSFLDVELTQLERLAHIAVRAEVLGAGG